jgi:hypothetical protein
MPAALAAKTLKPEGGIIDLDSISEGFPTTEIMARSGWIMDMALAEAATRRPVQGGGGINRPSKDSMKVSCIKGKCLQDFVYCKTLPPEAKSKRYATIGRGDLAKIKSWGH